MDCGKIGVIGWIFDRWATLKQAAGYRRYLIGGMVATVLAVIDAISGFRVMTWLTGIPAWGVILIVVLSFTVIWLLDYATDLP